MPRTIYGRVERGAFSTDFVKIIFLQRCHAVLTRTGESLAHSLLTIIDAPVYY